LLNNKNMPAAFRAKSVFFTLLCLAVPWAEAAGPGTSAANFLKIPVGAREAALGGAFTAVADNSDAVFYNPAGLGLLEVPEFSYSYNNYLTGVSQQWLSAAFPAGRGSFGLGVNHLSVKAFDAYDSADNRTGSVSAYDLAVYLGYGGRLETGSGLAPSLLYGAAVKSITEKLDDKKASGYAIDAGLLLLTGVKNLKLGFGLENLAASRLDFIGAGAKPAMKFKTGASYGIGTPGGDAVSLVSVDIAFPEDGRRYVSAGIENTLYGALSLRAGYSYFGDVSNGLSLGLGFGLPARGGREIRLDYSYGSSYDLGSIHRFGLSCKFGPRGAVQTKTYSAAAPAVPPAAAPATAQPDAEHVKEKEIEFKRQLDLLYGDDPAASRAAAEYLAGLDSPMVAEHFAALLSSGKAGWKLAALHGLARQKGARAGGLLESALADGDQEVRRQAALELGNRGEAASAAALQEALKTEESDEVKSALIEALEKLPAAVRE